MELDLNNLPIDDLPEEDLLHIDLAALNEDSTTEAKSMVEIVTDLFYDEQFKKEHPKIHRRIEMEIETLRGLIKMRKADEEAHDALLQAIVENKNNASLYRSMADIQKTSIAISNKIHDTLDRLNKICSDLTTEAPLSINEGGAEETEDSSTKAYRGSKDFIKEMLEQADN